MGAGGGSRPPGAPAVQPKPGPLPGGLPGASHSPECCLSSASLWPKLVEDIFFPGLFSQFPRISMALEGIGSDHGIHFMKH